MSPTENLKEIIMKKVLSTIAAHAAIGSITGLLLALMLVPFTTNAVVLGLAFYTPTFVTPLLFAIGAANALQEEEFMVGEVAHHGQK